MDAFYKKLSDDVKNPLYICSFDVGIKNLACCILKCIPNGMMGVNGDNDNTLNLLPYTVYIDKWEVFNLNEDTNKKASLVPLVVLGKTMMCKMDEFIHSYKKDIERNRFIVIIENQIGPLANKMKTIQGMLTQYFIMHNVETIEFISSSNKLKHWKDMIKTYSNHLSMKEMNTKDIQSYSGRKYHGVIATLQILLYSYFSQRLQNENTNTNYAITTLMDTYSRKMNDIIIDKKYPGKKQIVECYVFFKNILERNEIQSHSFITNIKAIMKPEKHRIYSGKNKKHYNTFDFERNVDDVKHIEQIKWFLQHKKKDDLADCLLQGLWFVLTHI